MNCLVGIGLKKYKWRSLIDSHMADECHRCREFGFFILSYFDTTYLYRVAKGLECVTV